MKTIITFTLLIMIGFTITGCATWNGLQQDSAQAWDATKRTIHNVTR